MCDYLLSHPEKKRVVDVKSFIKKWEKNGNRDEDTKKRIASGQTLHRKRNTRINVNRGRYWSFRFFKELNPFLESDSELQEAQGVGSSSALLDAKVRAAEAA